MMKLVDELIHIGIMYRNPSSPWASALHIVRKPSSAEWRITVNLDPVSKYTIPYQFTMLVIEHELGTTALSKKYANVEFTHSYWQFRLAEDSRVCHFIITPDGIFTPTCVLHGATNAVLHLLFFHTTKPPPDLMERVLLWGGDCLFHEETTKLLFQNLRRFFEFCIEWNWKLDPRK